MRDYYLFITALRDLTRPKRLLATALLVAIPLVIAIVWLTGRLGVAFESAIVYNTIEPGIVFGFVLVITSVIFGTGVVSQEIEQKTIVYLLTRPIPRWRLLLVRFAAVMVAVIVPLWFATIALGLIAYGPSEIAHSPVGRDLLILPVGALAYSGLFLLVATIINRPLMWGLLFAFGWESWVPNLGGSFKYVSIMSYLRTLSDHPETKSQSMDLTNILASLNPVTITTTQAWMVLIPLIAISLSAALLIFSHREYVPRDDSE